jgi:hypothetical protein
MTAQIAALVIMRKDAANLWDDDFYRAKIGGLLGMNQSQIKEESDRIKMTQNNDLLALTGGAGNVPII